MMTKMYTNIEGIELLENGVSAYVVDKPVAGMDEPFLINDANLHFITLKVYDEEILQVYEAKGHIVKAAK